MTDWKREDSVEKIVEKFKRFNMHVNMDLVRKAAKSMVMSKSEESKKVFQNILKQFETKIEILKLKVDKPFIEVPEPREGPVSLGNYMQGGQTYHECMVRIDDLIMSVVNAAPNKGKTNLLFHTCTQVHEYNRKNPTKKICMIILDRKKDFRNLPIPAVVLDIQDTRIDFFDEPPNSEKERWISDISNALMHAWGWMFASRNYFMSKVYGLAQYGKTPTLYEVFEEIKKDKESPGRVTNRQLEIQEVNLDRIQTALREFGKCMSTRKTFQLHEFIESGMPLVIEADMSPDSYAILFSWLLLYIYRMNKDNNVRGNLGIGGGVMVIADESYLLWETAKDHSEARRELGANFISLAPLYLRDFRCCIIAASQRPLSPDFMSAANTRIIGYTGDYKDAQYYANSLGNPDLVQTIMKLDVGEFLIKIGDKDAALIKVPHIPYERVSDETINEAMMPYKQAILEYCKEEQEEKKEEPKFKISEETKALLRNVRDYPDSTISFRYEKLGWKTNAAQQYVQDAVKSGYLRIVEDMLDSQKKAKYLVPTQQGIEWLRYEGHDVKDLCHVGKQTATHSLYQNILISRLKRLRHNVLHDHPVADKIVDVWAEKDRKVAYEICVNPAIEVSRALSVLGHVDEYCFVCKDLMIMQSIRSQINGEKIRFRLAAEFFQDLKRAVLDYYTEYRKNNPNNQDKQNPSPDDNEKPDDRSSD